MIGFLNGKLIAIEDSSIVLDVNGVGYQVLVPANLLCNLELSTPLALYVHTHFRETSLDLFGFEKIWQKKIFLMLLSASGVGPKTALGLMGSLDAMDILAALVRGDSATLSSAQGIGKKTAERMIVELETKAQKLMAELQGVSSAKTSKSVSGRAFGPRSIEKEAFEALINLGYKDTDASLAIELAKEKLETAAEPLTLDRVLKVSLQMMLSRKKAHGSDQAESIK